MSSPTMHRLDLPGLSGSHPLGMMAAFGLLRILDQESEFGHIQLGWTFDADWRAVLHIEEDVSLDEIINHLIQRQPERVVAPWLTWHDDIKCKPEQFRQVWQKLFDALANDAGNGNDENGDFSTERDQYEFAQFLTAYGSEFVLDKKAKPEVKPTAFHMTAGQQRFLKSVSGLATSLDPNEREGKRQTEDERMEELCSAYRTALQGSWTYQDSEHSLGWDPATEGLHALSDRSPSEAGPSSVRAAVWLAFESLPLFPAVPRGSRLQTTGFDDIGENLCWPIWETPISCDTVQMLLGLPELYEFPDKPRERHHWQKSLAARGIRVLMRAPCIRDANGRGTLRNPYGIPC